MIMMSGGKEEKNYFEICLGRRTLAEHLHMGHGELVKKERSLGDTH